MNTSKLHKKLIMSKVRQTSTYLWSSVGHSVGGPHWLHPNPPQPQHAAAHDDHAEAAVRLPAFPITETLAGNERAANLTS